MNHHFVSMVGTALVGVAGILGISAANIVTPEINPEIEPLIIQVVVALVTILGIWFRSRRPKS